jgi:hypothetical protein
MEGITKYLLLEWGNLDHTLVNDRGHSLYFNQRSYILFPQGNMY